jgi:hypothetical protein
MQTFYHGTTRLFKKFDLAHALEGDGKNKYGFGTNVTEVYTTAALYAHNKKRPECTDYYVYTVEIPDLTDDNHLSYTKPVHPSIIQRTEKALGEQIPDEIKAVAKYFRKYVGNKLIGKRGTLKQLKEKSDIDAERAASKFFSEIGLEYYVWPQGSWTKPSGLTNRAVLNVDKIRIVRIDKVELDKKFKYVEGSKREIPLDSF